MDSQSLFSRISREGKYAIVTFLSAACLFIGLSVFATDIGTNITSSGSLFASSSLDVTSNATIHGGLAVRNGAGAATTSAGGLVAKNADIGMMQIGTGSVVSKMQFGTCSVNPPMLKPGFASTTTCTASTVSTADKVFLTPPGFAALSSGRGNTVVFVGASTTAASTINIEILNTSTTTAVDVAAGTWSWIGLR